MAKDQAARIPADVLQMARTITSVTGETISKLIGDTCRPVFVERIKQLQKSGAFIPKPVEEEDE